MIFAKIYTIGEHQLLVQMTNDEPDDNPDASENYCLSLSTRDDEGVQIELSTTSTARRLAKLPLMASMRTKPRASWVD